MQYRLWNLLSLSFVVYAGFVALQLGNVNLSPDQWHCIHFFLSQDFLSAINSLQNDHRTVFPNLIHYINWIILRNSQEPVMWLGMGMALLTALLLVRLIHTDDKLTNRKKAMLSALAVMTIFWMGNGDVLFRSNESWQSYLVISPLILALMAIFNLREPNPPTPIFIGRILLIITCGVIATLSFGAGVVVLPALTGMAILNRSPRHSIAILGAVSITVCGLYLYTYPLTNNLSTHLLLESSFYVRVCRWLGAPLAAMLSDNLLVRIFFSPLPDWPSSNSLVYLTSSLAAAALIYMVFIAIAALAGKQLSRTTFTVLGTGLFVVGVGMTIELARAKLQLFNPQDIFSTRYFVWSSLFWFCIAGLPICNSQSSRWQTKIALETTGIVLAALIAMNNPFWASRVWQPMRNLYDLWAFTAYQNALPEDGIHGNLMKPKKFTLNDLMRAVEQMNELHIPVYDSKSYSPTDKVCGEVQRVNAPPIEVLRSLRNTPNQNPSILVGASLPCRGIFEVVDQSGQHRGLLVPTVQYRGVLDTLINRHSRVNYLGVLDSYQAGKTYYLKSSDLLARSLQ